MKESRVITHGAMFAGIGGFDLGFERVGIRSLWQIELNDYCRALLKQRFPDAEQFYDVKNCGGESSYHVLKSVDVISGGFPCQDISTSGKGAGLNGKRSGLWSEIKRIASELRPRFVVVENVAALLDRGMGRVLGDLAEIGYDAEWEVLRASDFGAPHRRERVFIVAYSNEERREFRIVFREMRAQKDHWQTDYGAACLDVWNRPERVPPASVRMADGLSNELDAERIGACGNAIVPQIAEYIGRRIVEIMSEEKIIEKSA